MIENKLVIYPTTRKILSNLLHLDNTLIEKSISINVFFQKVFFVKNKRRINQNSRVLFLKEALLKVNKDLGFGDEFKKNFIYFLKNSSFILRFFDEIFAEKSSLEEIETHDLQGEFIDHIETLKEIYKEYSLLLEEKNFYDNTTLLKYEINTNFINEYTKIEFILEGYLSKKEFEICNLCAKKVDFYIRIYSTKYNKKMLKLFDIEFELDFEYLINLSTKQIVNKKQITNLSIFDLQHTTNRISQCSLVAKKIYEFIEIDKFHPEKIAVILPDESFSQTLNKLDLQKNLNFAMGFSFSSSLFYKKLEAFLAYLSKNDAENKLRIEFLQLEHLAKDIRDKLSDKSLNGFEIFFDFIKELLELNKDDKHKESVLQIVNENLFFFQSLKLELISFSFNELLSYFMHLLKSSSLSHASGGKIKVMGILESRNLIFDGVIIIDFNEDIVPKISQKDFFLNSNIKKYSNIPTKRDRENLQKYYYKRLTQNSKKVAISFVLNDEKIPSKFLNELDIKNKSELSLDNKLMFKTSNTQKHLEIKPFEYKNESLSISSNKLATFIKCKLKFYNYYILDIKLKNTTTLELDNAKFGLIIHPLIKEIKDKTSLQNFTQTLMQNAQEYKNNNNYQLYFEILKLKESIKPFISYMQKKFDNGIKIKNEQYFEFKKSDYLIKGRIDKIEIGEDEVSVVDYKIKTRNTKLANLSKYEKLQLYIYNLYISQSYKDKKVTSYNHYLPHNKKSFLEINSKLEDEFENYLKEYKEPFIVEQTQEKAICKFCEYATMCNKN